MSEPATLTPAEAQFLGSLAVADLETVLEFEASESFGYWSRIFCEDFAALEREFGEATDERVRALLQAELRRRGYEQRAVIQWREKDEGFNATDLLSALETLGNQATSAFNILDGAGCPVDDPEAWKREVRRDLAQALATAAKALAEAREGQAQP